MATIKILKPHLAFFAIAHLAILTVTNRRRRINKPSMLGLYTVHFIILVLSGHYTSDRPNLSRKFRNSNLRPSDPYEPYRVKGEKKAKSWGAAWLFAGDAAVVSESCVDRGDWTFLRRCSIRPDQTRPTMAKKGDGLWNGWARLRTGRNGTGRNGTGRNERH